MHIIFVTIKELKPVHCNLHSVLVYMSKMNAGLLHHAISPCKFGKAINSSQLM